MLYACRATGGWPDGRDIRSGAGKICIRMVRLATGADKWRPELRNAERAEYAKFTRTRPLGTFEHAGPVEKRTASGTNSLPRQSPSFRPLVADPERLGIFPRILRTRRVLPSVVRMYRATRPGCEIALGCLVQTYRAASRLAGDATPRVS